MKYRKLNTYKYIVMEDYSIGLMIGPTKDLVYRFLELSTTGRLLIKKGYAWDGATGLPITPKNMMRGSLVHDALYQLMRLGDLDHIAMRGFADQTLRQICMEDGMSVIEADVVYDAVRLLGEQFAKPTPQPEVVVLEAP